MKLSFQFKTLPISLKVSKVGVNLFYFVFIFTTFICCYEHGFLNAENFVMLDSVCLLPFPH